MGNGKGELPGGRRTKEKMNLPDYELADMHIHIMPEVDDGSESMEMTMEMLRIARENRIGTMILTPHHKGGHRNVSPNGQRRRIAGMQDAMEASGEWNDNWMDLYPGNEIMYDSSVPEELEEGRIQTMADSSYVLVEFKPWEEFSYIQEGLRNLSYEGYRVILAHCERYDCIRRDAALAGDLVRNRIYLQVNADDVLPRFRSPFAKFVSGLLKEELVSFIGTDAHKDRERSPQMLRCWQYLARKYDPDYVREITRENTLRIIADEEV